MQVPHWEDLNQSTAPRVELWIQHKESTNWHFWEKNENGLQSVQLIFLNSIFSWLQIKGSAIILLKAVT